MHHLHRENVLCKVLALMRAMYMHYQTAHWTTREEAFYGDHLLYQRLYENLEEEIDMMAEKLVGLESERGVDLHKQMEKIEDFVEKAVHVDCPLKRAILMEKMLQKMLKKAYDVLDGTDQLTLGLDDFLMSLANDHETHLYLLGQRKKDDRED